MGNSTIYKVLKQGYPATHNFKDLADGTAGTDIPFITGGADAAHCIIVSDWQGHKKVMSFFDDDGTSTFVHDLDIARDSGVIELFWGSNDVANMNFRIQLRDVSDICYYFRFVGSQIQSSDATVLAATANNTLYHLKIQWYADNTIDLWVEGDLVLDGDAFDINMTTGITRTLGYCYSNDNTKFTFIDAWGEKWDPNYNVGDNLHWRNYKESTDSFEGDDVGTQGTSITWVDIVDTAASVELVQEFNDHKKILRQTYTSAVGDYDYAKHNFASQSKTGWFEFWLKVSDITVDSYIRLLEVEVGTIIILGIGNSVFEYYANGGPWTTVPSSPTPVADTWYHIYIQWYDAANDNFDLWIDNFQYLDGVQTILNMGDGIDSVETREYSATEYMYIDAPTSSLDSDKRADNRTFEYHSQTKTDITSKCSECYITKSITTYATAYIEISETLGNEHYLQIIDENSDLRFIGNRFKDIDIGISINSYSFQGLNKVDLETESTYSASSAEDVNASLVGIFTNVGQEDGRLIYYTKDDPAGNLTPNYRNKPNHMVIRILAIRGGKKAIIKASGKIFLDDDANPDNGAATITETSDELMGIPMIDRASHQINYVEVRGGIDPDTGTPFSGVSEDTDAQADGTGLIPYYKRLRELQSDIDCQNVAIAIRTGPNFAPQILRVRLRGIYADPGEVINFANANKSFSATNCYVDSVRMNVLNNICFYSLNTGIFDPITLNAPGYTMADETADDIAETLYNTDINTVSLYINPYLSVHGSAGIECATDKGILTHFPISSKVDITRDITITFTFTTGVVGGATIDGELFINRYVFDGSADKVVIENALNWDYTTTATWGYTRKVYTLSASDIVADSLIYIRWMNVDATTAVVADVQLVYHQKRNV